MDMYNIIITPDAESDLWELRDYIADVLLVPDIAKSYIQEIQQEIDTLSEMPTRYKLVDEEPWHSLGVRKIVAKNFLVYYHTNEDTKCVYIMNVIYQRRDQLRALSRSILD